MKGRNLHCILGVLLFFFILSVPLVRAAEKPAINVDPEQTEVDIGQTFIVTINATNWGEPGLWGYELKVNYDNTKLEALEVTIPTDHFLNPQDPMAMWLLMSKFINQTGGFVSIAGIMTAPEPPHAGNGTLATIQFNGTALGECALEIEDVICVGVDPTTWVSFEISLDDYDLNDSNITVIPEFPAFLIAPLFLIATLVAIALRKKAWPSKNT